MTGLPPIHKQNSNEASSNSKKVVRKAMDALLVLLQKLEFLVKLQAY
jgi:hypothetical protein